MSLNKKNREKIDKLIKNLPDIVATDLDSLIKLMKHIAISMESWPEDRRWEVQATLEQIYETIDSEPVWEYPSSNSMDTDV